jgi:hypothetical protein
MEHSEATQQMAVERYLLDELSAEEKEAFEQHVFDCPECALDLRATSTFITEAKAQLPALLAQSSVRETVAPAKPAAKKNRFAFWLQPGFALPAFAVMLAVIAYQNLSTIPALRNLADAPRILHSTAIHLGTRGAAHTAIPADHTEGLALSIELPQSTAYSSFVFELYDPNGKLAWTQSVAASNPDTAESGIVSLVIPGPGLQEASYTMAVFGVTPQNTRVEIDKRILDVHFNH